MQPEAPEPDIFDIRVQIDWATEYLLWHTQLIVHAVKYLIMGYYFHFSSFLGEKRF